MPVDPSGLVTVVVAVLVAVVPPLASAIVVVA
jgi:hypothetical protein